VVRREWVRWVGRCWWRDRKVEIERRRMHEARRARRSLEEYMA